MRWGISADPIPAGLRYAKDVQQAAEELDFPPLFAYAIACRESILGEIAGEWNAAKVVSGDGGHGLCQLTSSYPPDWEDPYANARYAIKNFLLPAVSQWHAEIPSLAGDDLIRCAAAAFNAGFGGAWSGHKAGDVDKYTTGRYGQGVLDIFHRLQRTGRPNGG